MSIANIFISPFNLLFLILLVGLALGQIRIHKITLGIAGVLFAAILVGSFIKHFVSEIPTETLSNTQATMKTFATLGSSLFVSVIGLQTGLSLKNNSKGSIIAFAVGALMSLSGVIIMLLISLIDHTTSYSTLLGILCGALTSTPGLSTVCELLGSDANAAVVGYSCSYFGGVLLVVILSQAFVRGTESSEAPKVSNAPTSKIWLEIILICTIALLGNIFGQLFSNLFGITLGNTAFALLFGLIIGFATQKIRYHITISATVLNTFRNLGLSLFFIGTGFNTGVRAIEFNIKMIVYGALITLTSISCGIILCKFRFCKSLLNTGFVISGGMTSSPAYGAISSYSKGNSLSNFSFAYFGGLVSLVIILQIII